MKMTLSKVSSIPDDWQSPCPSASEWREKRQSPRVRTSPIRRSVTSKEYMPGNSQSNMDYVTSPTAKKLPQPRKPQSSARDFMAEVMQPLSDQEKAEFKGWVELESDPALFNSILRQYGVRDVKVQEVLSLDDEMLAFLPKPIHGLIFLFKYRDDDAEDAEDPIECPEHVWFANQISPNLCATSALFNIIMNAVDVDLGEKISSFKSSTQVRTPVMKGQMLSQDDFIRQHHNSFARKMDLLNADLTLCNDVAAWSRRRNTPKKSGGVNRKRPANNEACAFHFVAFVPVDGTVWRLDGLQNQPVNLGRYQDDWMTLARANIHERIDTYEEDGVQFNLLALCRSPMKTIPEKLAQQIKVGLTLEVALSLALPNWRQYVASNGSLNAEESKDCFGLTTEILDAAQLPWIVNTQLLIAGTDTDKLIDMHQQCLQDQSALKLSYIEEVSLITLEHDQVTRRKEDHTPMIFEAMKILAEEGVLRDIIMALNE